MVYYYLLKKHLCLFTIFFLFTAQISPAAQWQQCYAPLGGDVTCLDTFGGYLFVGMQDGGVFRSANNGMTWQEANNGMHTNYNSGVLALMHVPGKIFAGTKNGLFVSTDMGNTWDSVALNQQVTSLVQQGSYLYAAEYGNVWRSNDNGVTWTPLTAGLPTPFTYTPYQLVSVQGRLIVRTIGFGMYSSDDNGDTWTAFSNPPGITYAPNFLKVIDNRLFISYYSDGFFYSDDAGDTWQTDLSSSSAFIIANDIAITDGKYIVTGSAGMWSRPVSGGSWTNVVQNLTDPRPTMYGILKTPNGIFIGSAEGVVFIDTMLTNYEIRRDSMTGTYVYFLDGYNNRVLSHVNYQREICTSTDNGLNWSFDSFTNYYYTQLTASVVSNNKWYVSLGAGMNISSDGGQNWNFIFDPVIYYRTMYSLLDDNGTVYGGSDSGRIFKIVNDNSFVLYSTPFPPDQTVKHMMKAGNYWFCAPSSINTEAMFRSADNGMSWTPVSGGWPVGSQRTDGIVYQDNRLLAFSDGYGIFASTDFGDTWHHLDNGFPPNASVNDAKMLNGKVYAVAGNYEQLYSLASGDTTWVCENCGTTDPIRAASVWATDSVLFMGTHNKGVWRRVLPQPNTVANVNTKTIKAACFPNPGNTITIQLDGSDIQYPVGINIHSVDGKLCEHTSTSNSKALLDLPKLIPGLYFIELTDNAGRHTFIKWTKR